MKRNSIAIVAYRAICRMSMASHGSFTRVDGPMSVAESRLGPKKAVKMILSIVTKKS